MSFSFAYKCQKFCTYPRACFGFFGCDSRIKITAKKNHDKNRYIIYRNNKGFNKMLLLGS